MGEAFLMQAGKNTNSNPCLEYINSGIVTGYQASANLSALEKGRYVLFVHQTMSATYGNYSNKGHCSIVEFDTNGTDTINNYEKFYGTYDHYVTSSTWREQNQIDPQQTSISLSITNGIITANWTAGWNSSNISYYDHVWVLYKIKLEN